MKKIKSKLRNAVLDWLGIPFDLNSAFWAEWNTKAAGQNVNEQSILSLSAAWACVRLISETISTLPLHLYERTPDGRKQATNHPMYYIIHNKPNIDSTATTYWESEVASMLLHGNAISRKLMIGNRIVGLEYLPWDRLSIQKLGNGDYKIYYIEKDNTRTLLDNKEIFNIPGFSLNGKWGISAIRYGASVFGSALASNVAANTTFENGLSPTVAFQMDRVLNKEQREDFRTGLEAIRGALNAGKSPLLEGGMKAETIGIPPKDAQLLESRAFSVEEVCRWFGVDPSMVGHGNAVSNWGTGLEQKMIAFLTFTLRPWLTRIEQAINSNLLTPAERTKYYAEFSIEGLLRADSAGRSAFYSTMVNNGIFTRDEVRQRENLPTMGGNANVLTVQSAMIPINDIGKASDGEQIRNALASWLKEEQNEQNKAIT